MGEGLGLSPGTVRTALSRMRKEGYLETVKEGSVTRYRVSPLQLEVMDNFMRRPARGRDGYAVAVYSFESSQERQRALARSLLECEGFVRFAQNSYISSRIDVRRLRSKLRESGLSGQVFIFETEGLDAEDLERMAEAWGVAERASFLQGFYRYARAHLEGWDGTDADAFLRQAAVWVAFVVRVQSTEPPLPPELLPEDYPYRALGAYLKRSTARHGRRLLRYYLSRNR